MSEYERYELCICICMYAWYINKPSHTHKHRHAHECERVRARRRIVVVFVAFCFLTGAQGGDWRRCRRRCRCFFCVPLLALFSFFHFRLLFGLRILLARSRTLSLSFAVFMTAPLPTPPSTQSMTNLTFRSAATATPATTAAAL